MVTTGYKRSGQDIGELFVAKTETSQINSGHTIVLGRDPSAAMEAATKGFVETYVANNAGTGSGGLGTLTFEAVSANFLAQKNTGYIVTTGSNIQATLPSAPTVGDTVVLVYANPTTPNLITVMRNGSNIENVSENLDLDVKDQFVTFVYGGTVPGWRVSTGQALVVGGGGGNSVTSVNGLTGDVVITAASISAAASNHTHAGTYAPLAHTHAIADVTNLQTSLNAKAPLASPALTGTPTAPTAAANTNTTQLATTAFVQAAVASVVAGGGGVASVNGLTGVVNLTAANVGAADVSHTHTGYAATGHTHTEYSPTAHTHSGYAATSHSHTISQVTDLQTTLNGKSDTTHTHTGYANASHTHAIADSTGLQAALNGKAPTAHTHDIADVTNLQATINAKANLASPALTGVPTAPTAANGTATTQVATTAFATAAASLAVVNSGFAGQGTVWSAVANTGNISGTNNTGRPVMWMLRDNTAEGGGGLYITIGGVYMDATYGGWNEVMTVVVPPGATYSFNSGSGAISAWKLG